MIWSESRDTTRGLGGRRPPAARPAPVGGRAPRRAWSTTPSTPSSPTAPTRLLVVTNDDAQEFRLARCPVPRDADQDHRAWEPVRPEDPAERLERVDAFATHAVLELPLRGPAPAAGAADRRARLRRLRGRPAVRGGHRRPVAQRGLRRDRRHGRRRVLRPPAGLVRRRPAHRRAHRAAPAGGPAATTRTPTSCETRTFPAPDGTQVPATLVRRRDTPLDGTAPALLYGYGAYEAVDDPEWDPALPSLLDARRGLRATPTSAGGGEGGRRWWIEGHLEHKQNTFTDHIAVADGLDGLVDGTRLGHPRPQRRWAAPGRRAQPAARTGGERSWPRCRSSTWSPRCSTPPSR